MKKTVTVLLGAALCVAAASCAEGPQKRNDRMETKNSLTEQEKAAGILTAEVQEISREVTARHLHTVQEVLVESINEQDASLVTGRMSNNTLVHFPGDASMIGTLQNVSLDECRGFYYMGTLV